MNIFKKKIVSGLKGITVKKLDTNPYNLSRNELESINIEGAKSIDITLNYETTEYKKGVQVGRFEKFKGGNGTLGVIGLTLEEMSLLFGHKIIDKTLEVKSTDKAPRFELSFDKTDLEGNVKRYIIHSVTFKPIGVTGSTRQGSINEESVDIDFYVDEVENNKIYSIEEL